MSTVVIFAKDMCQSILEGDEKALGFLEQNLEGGDSLMVVPAALAWALMHAEPREMGVQAMARLLWRAEVSPIGPTPTRELQSAVLASNVLLSVARGRNVVSLRRVSAHANIVLSVRSLALALFACAADDDMDLRPLGEALDTYMILTDKFTPPVDVSDEPWPSAELIAGVHERGAPDEP